MFVPLVLESFALALLCGGKLSNAARLETDCRKGIWDREIGDALEADKTEAFKTKM
jgi:hypothetical protein